MSANVLAAFITFALTFPSFVCLHASLKIRLRKRCDDSQVSLSSRRVAGCLKPIVASDIGGAILGDAVVKVKCAPSPPTGSPRVVTASTEPSLNLQRGGRRAREACQRAMTQALRGPGRDLAGRTAAGLFGTDATGTPSEGGAELFGCQKLCLTCVSVRVWNAVQNTTAIGRGCRGKHPTP